MGHTTSPRPTIRLEEVSRRGSKRIDRIDRVVVESPLTIVVEGQVVATTMRTPGHDLDLAAGWLVSEAGLRRSDDIVEMKALAASPHAGVDSDEDGGAEEIDTVRVHIAPGITPPRPRAYVTSSSCGVCSADIIDELSEPYANLHDEGWRLEPQQALDLIEQMRSRQKMFDLTGALHAAALVGPHSEVLFVREDVGRHNAVDKVIGRALMDGLLPLTNHVLVVSGRVSYEIVAKALSACIGSIVAVSGPTTLAVEVAKRHDLLLIGFARDDRMNVYSGSEWVRA
ncbi:MAG: formate dehydrogenase accessory sulfurtransferase FdhD [Candidatus Nanopelagicales bacterium]